MPSQNFPQKVSNATNKINYKMRLETPNVEEREALGAVPPRTFGDACRADGSGAGAGERRGCGLGAPRAGLAVGMRRTKVLGVGGALIFLVFGLTVDLLPALLGGADAAGACWNEC